MDTQEQKDAHEKNRKVFAVCLILTEIVVVVFYGIFVRVKPHEILDNNQTYYPMYQDVNVMMLVGFGFLMTFIKRHSWSALSYTFFINAVVVQLYILLSAFWERVFHGDWGSKIEVLEQSFTGASYSVAAILIAFGAVLGKVGPLELFIMSLFGIIGYTLNESLVYSVIGINDAGGSTAIHTYGAYFGLTVSLIISKVLKPQKIAEGSYVNSTFAMIGTLFLWMFWPSFNAGYFPENGFQRSLIVSNTIIALTGSCLSTFAFSTLLRDKFSMEDILNATLAGGVAIGAPSGVVQNPGLSLFIGLLAGAISTAGFCKLSGFLFEKIGLHDTCGVHNLHGIPGLLGGIISGIVIGGYSRGSGIFDGYQDYLDPLSKNRSFYQQGGAQVAATFISMGIGIGVGILTGFILRCFYKFINEELFEDKVYFEVPEEEVIEKPNPKEVESPGQKRKLPPINFPTREEPSEIVLDATN